MDINEQIEEMVNPKSNELLVQRVLSNFNFRRVKHIMDTLELSWMNGIPNLDEIKSKSRELLQNAIKGRLNSKMNDNVPFEVSTGGLKATAFCSDDKKEIYSLKLEFVIEDFEIINNKFIK